MFALDRYDCQAGTKSGGIDVVQQNFVLNAFVSVPKMVNSHMMRIKEIGWLESTVIIEVQEVREAIRS